MKKYITLTLVVIFAILLFGSIYYIKKKKENLKECPFVLCETESEIEYLTHIHRIDRKNSEYLPYIGADDFFLCYHRIWCYKESNLVEGSYTMHVIPDSINGYKVKTRLDKRCVYYDNGIVEHSEISGEWHDANDLDEFLNYYFTHKSQIPVITNQPVDISCWKPLFTIFEEDSHQQRYVLRLTKREHEWSFDIYCEVLTVINVLPTGELDNYSLSTYVLKFGAMKEKCYVEIECYSTKLYTAENKEGITFFRDWGDEDPDPYPKRGWANEIDFSRKVLEYYLAHKSEIEIEIIDNTPKEYLLIIAETNDNIEYLTNIYRDSRKKENHWQLPYIGKNDFFLKYEIDTRSKQDYSYTKNNYAMHVIPDKDGYKTKLRMEAGSFYEYNKCVGYVTPNRIWSSDGEFTAIVLNYYFAHKSEIEIITDDER